MMEEHAENSKPGEPRSDRPAGREILPYPLSRFFDDDFWDFDFFRPRGLARFARGFFPQVDVAETEAEVRVTADIPGVNPDKIEIEAHDNRLVLFGSLERESAGNADERPYRYERARGSFRREITLPARVDGSAARAVYKDGVLAITLPKAAGERKNKIKILPA